MPACANCRTDFTPGDGNALMCPACEAALGGPRVSTPSALPATAPAATPSPATTSPAAPVPARSVFGLVLLVGLGLLVLAVLLAESGALAAEKTETKSKAEGRYEFESSWSGPRGLKATPLRGVRFTPSVVVSVPRGAGYDLATETAAAIKKSAPAGSGGSGGGAPKLEITLARVVPDGASWVPFHKSGSCTFAATYTLSAETAVSSFVARGQVNGDVTQSMTGFCSSGLYREKMAQAIAAAILGDIAKLVAKHS